MGRTMRSRGVSSYRAKKRSKRGNKLNKRLSKRRVKRTTKRSNKRLNKRSNRRLNRKSFKRVSKRMRNNRKSFRKRGGAPGDDEPNVTDEYAGWKKKHLGVNPSPMVEYYNYSPEKKREVEAEAAQRSEAKRVAELALAREEELHKEYGDLDDYSIIVEGHEKLLDADRKEYVDYRIVLYKGRLQKKVSTVMHRWSEVVKLYEGINDKSFVLSDSYWRKMRFPRFFNGVIFSPLFKNNSEKKISERKGKLNEFFAELARYINDVRKSEGLREAFSHHMGTETEIDLIRGAKYVDPNEVIKKFFETQTDRYVAAERAQVDREKADEKADAAKMRSSGAYELEAV